MALPTLPVPALPTLLVVDDEPDLASLFRRCLRGSFEVLEAHGTDQVEALLAQGTVTHLVVDGSLPGGPAGPELVRRWRLKTPSVRFAALFSGHTELRGSALPGVDGCYLKPDGFEALVADLKRSAGSKPEA